MATIGFEVHHDDYMADSTSVPRCSHRAPKRGNGRYSQRRTDSFGDISSASSSRRDHYCIRGVTSTSSSTNPYYEELEGGSTASSVFSSRSKSQDGASDDGEAEAARKRKCKLRMMAFYVLAAIATFLTVLLWRLGFIFESPPDQSMSAISSSSSSTGYDEEGYMLCNGNRFNCYRRANEIMYATVHNAMSSQEDGFLAYNNLYPLEDALAAGFRGLSLDSCDCTRVGIQFCHGVCVAGFRRPLATMAVILKWLLKNPHEVIVIEIQVMDQSLGPLFMILQDLPFLEEIMYHHPKKGEPWPKLKDMIEMNKRLIVFAHDDDACEEDPGQCPMGVHSTFDYAFETPFSSKGVDELMNVTYTCDVNRGWSNSDFVISNQFAVDDNGLPSIDIAAQTNSMENLISRTASCHDMFRQYRDPVVINLLVVDFWNVGSVVEFVDKYNSELPPLTEAPTDSPTSAPSISPAPTLPMQQLLLSPSPSSSPTTMTPTVTDTATPITIEPTFVPTSMPSTATPTTTNPTVAPPVESGPGFPAFNSTLEVNASSGNALLSGAVIDYVPPPSTEMTTMSPNDNGEGVDLVGGLGGNESSGNALLAGATFDDVPPTTTVSPSATMEGVDLVVGGLGSNESVGVLSTSQATPTTMQDSVVVDGESNSSVLDVTAAPTLDVWSSLQAIPAAEPDSVVVDEGSNGIVADVTIAPTLAFTEPVAQKREPDLEHSDTNDHEVSVVEKDSGAGGWRW